MTLTYRVGAGGSGTVDLGDVVFLGDMPGFTERAGGDATGGGGPGMSGVTIQDPGGSLNLTGLNKFVVEESACTSNVRIFTGISQERGIGRGEYTTGAGRVWDMGVMDSNGYLHLRVIRDGNHGNRPAETDVQRVAWLLAEVLHAGHVQNGTGGLFGANGPTAGVIAAPRNLDAADYRNQHADDVLADIGPPGNRRFFTYWDPTLEKVCLFYGLDSENLGDSTLRISNVAADADAVTFAPFQDANLTRDPTDVFGGLNYTYRHGTIYREDPATIASFLDRSVAIENDRVGLQATASTFIDRLLDKASTERDTVTCTIRIPRAQVNLVIAGMRIQVKFTHLPGLTSFTWRYVLARTVWQEVANAEFYYVTLELSDNIGGGISGGGAGGGPFVPGTTNDCEILGQDHTTDLYDIPIGPTPSGFYPISSTFGTTGDFVAGVPEGLVFYLGGSPRSRPVPNPTNVSDGTWGGWSFSTHSVVAGSMPGGIGDGGLAPTVQIVVVGPGTMDIWLADLGAAVATAELYSVVIVDPDDGASDIETLIETKAATFPTTSFAVPDDGACLHYAVINYNTGSYLYGGFDWALGGTAFTPTHGQTVTETATGLAAGATYTTNYPYYPNSLQVHVGGVAVVPTQTNPAAGTFTLPISAIGSQVLITYQASHGTGTGAGNVDEPVAVVPVIPAELLDGKLDRTGGGGDIIHAHGNAGAAETVDPALGNVHTLTLDANLTLTLTGPATGRGRTIVLKLTQNGTGGWTVTWPGSVVWPDGIAPTIAPAAGAVTFVTLFTTDGGTTWYGFASGGGAAIDYAEVGDLAAVGTTAAAGVSTEIPRADHVHVIDPSAVQNAGRWELVMEDGVTAPPVPVTNEAEDDWLYAWTTD